MVNRSQGLVLAFLAAVWLLLLVISALDPSLYTAALRPPLPVGSGGEIGLLSLLTFLVAFLALGTLRRWRWTFWLVVVAFAAGALRIPASALELAGVLPPTGPAWYVALQAVIGAVQVGIAVVLLIGYRRHGVWGRF